MLLLSKQVSTEKDASFKKFCGDLFLVVFEFQLKYLSKFYFTEYLLSKNDACICTSA